MRQSFLESNNEPRFTHFMVNQKVFDTNPLKVVDVGARNGAEGHWNVYCDQVQIIGFEPDIEECEKINRTAPENHSFFPIFLGRKKEKRMFHITNLPNASGFHEPNMNLIKRYAFEKLLTVEKTIEVETIDLDSFVLEHDIGPVDFIKIDVEGAELDVLEGAKNLLRKLCLGLSIEVLFDCKWRNQPSFCDIDSFLQSLGFKLFNLVPGPLAKKSFFPFDFYCPESREMGQISWAQALYLRDCVGELESMNKVQERWDKIRILKLITLMEIFNLNDCAAELLLYASQKACLENDMVCLLDYLTPTVKGRIISYEEWLDYLEIKHAQRKLKNKETFDY